MIAELQQRKVQFYQPIWDYDYVTLVNGNPIAFMTKMDEVCAQWFGELPAIYGQVYDALVEKNKYRFTGRYVYKNNYSGEGLGGPQLSSVVLKYASNNLQIEHNPNCYEEIGQCRGDDGFFSMSRGLLFGQFIQRKTPLYDAVHCLMYQGICEALGFECRGLHIGWGSLSLF